MENTNHSEIATFLLQVKGGDLPGRSVLTGSFGEEGGVIFLYPSLKCEDYIIPPIVVIDLQQQAAVTLRLENIIYLFQCHFHNGF